MWDDHKGGNVRCIVTLFDRPGRRASPREQELTRRGPNARSAANRVGRVVLLTAALAVVMDAVGLLLPHTSRTLRIIADVLLIGGYIALLATGIGLLALVVAVIADGTRRG